MQLTIGKLAKQAGVTVETIRYYQRFGLLQEPVKPAKSDQQIVTLDMQNMTCTMCQFTIKKALQNVAGVQQVAVDYDSKTATINFDAKKLTVKL